MTKFRNFVGVRAHRKQTPRGIVEVDYYDRCLPGNPDRPGVSGLFDGLAVDEHRKVLFPITPCTIRRHAQLRGMRVSVLVNDGTWIRRDQ